MGGPIKQAGSTVLEPKTTIAADPAEILRHLSHITRRWHELTDHAPMLEVVYLSSADRAEVKHVGHYRITPEALAEAAADIAEMNKHKINAYCVVNPLDGYNMPRANGRAARENILASFFQWADADDAQAAENIRQFVGPKCTFHVLTGTQPSMRPHVYWELEQPVIGRAALDEWEQVQKAIAATLKTDPSVTDSPRIMRLAGTVNWPKPQKIAKGYIPEITTLRIYDPAERPPVSSERMQRAFAGPQPSLSQQATPQGPGSFEIDTGGVAASLDRERLAIQALSGNEWHNAVIRLVASYVAKGLSDGEIQALTVPLTLPGYTTQDTAAEVQTAIDGARRKGWTPDPQASMVRDLTPQEIEAIPAALFKPWANKDLTAIPYPHFVYSDFYARGYTSVTLAPPKVGKSMLGLAEAIDIATGRGFLTGVEREPQRVVYFNAEDDQDVIDSRVAALLTHYDIAQSEIIGRLFATSGVDMSDFYMVSGQEGIINEPLFVSIEKFIREESADALIFDPLQDLSRSPETNEVFRLLGQRLRRMASSTGVALGLIHHTRKIAPGVTPTIDDGRGGSALRGTARFNRLLIGMTEDEGAKAGVINHRHYLRVGDMESNLAPPSADLNRWFEKTSVITPNGHSVGAIQPWKWPDAFDGISRQDSARVRSAIASMGEPPRENVRSSAWAGVVIGDILGIDVTDPAGKTKVQSIMAKWILTDVLRVETVHDARNGRAAKIIVAGENNPMTEVSQ